MISYKHRRYGILLPRSINDTSVIHGNSKCQIALHIRSRLTHTGGQADVSQQCGHNGTISDDTILYNYW